MADAITAPEAAIPTVTTVSPAVVSVPEATNTTLVTSTGTAFTPNAFIVNIHGTNINLMSVLIGAIILGLITTFFRLQVSKKMDFADMLTMDGRKVSLTKVLQLVGGLSATWVIIKMAAVGTLSSELFGIYLTYVGAIEGFSKFMSAKYGYTETSVKDGGGTTTAPQSTVQDSLQQASQQAGDAESSAQAARVTVLNASADLKTKE